MNIILIGHSYKMYNGKSIYTVVNIFNEETVVLEDNKTKEYKNIPHSLFQKFLKNGLWEEIITW